MWSRVYTIICWKVWTYLKNVWTLICSNICNHFNLTLEFCAALCMPSNLKRQEQKFVTVLVHGSLNYDSHYTVRQLGYDIKSIHLIPNTKGKHTYFQKKRYRFQY